MKLGRARQKRIVSAARGFLVLGCGRLRRGSGCGVWLLRSRRRVHNENQHKHDSMKELLHEEALHVEDSAIVRDRGATRKHEPAIVSLPVGFLLFYFVR